MNEEFQQQTSFFNCQSKGLLLVSERSQRLPPCNERCVVHKDSSRRERYALSRFDRALLRCKRGSSKKRVTIVTTKGLFGSSIDLFGKCKDESSRSVDGKSWRHLARAATYASFPAKSAARPKRGESPRAPRSYFARNRSETRF
jgi:hypothetical protein